MIFLPDFYAEIKKIEQEMQDLLDRIHQGKEGLEPGAYGNLTPPVDIFEQDDRLSIIIDVPGMKAEDIHIQFSNGFLVVTGRKSAPPYHSDPTSFVCMERSFGTFRRKVYIQQPVELDKARATLNNGILTVTLVTRTERRGAPYLIPVENTTNETDE